MRRIDARGLTCPAPVLQTKATIEQENIFQIEIVVDNPAAQQNVQRFLESQGFDTTSDRDGNDYTVVGQRAGDSQPAYDTKQPQATRKDALKIMVMCATDRIGYGDDELGLKLMISFIKTLKEMGTDLWRLVFVNNGVKLCIDGSQALQDIKDIESSGVKILVCGTCLTHFDLLEEKQVGETTNMLDIVTAMQLADKVINM